MTGIHGFVGSNLVKSLASEHTFFGLDIISPINKDVVFTFSWDDLDKGQLPDVDVIIHLAGKAHDTKNASNKDVYFSVNTGLTQKIYDFFLRSKAQKFIFFSTVKAVADKVEDVLTEDVMPAPIGPYGESKLKAEEYIMAHFPPEKHVYIFRPCMIHGPGNKGNLNLLYSIIKKGIPWPLGAYNNRRTFTSIDNLSYVISGVLRNDIPSGIYNIGDDEPLSTNELIDSICTSLGRKAHIWKLPKGLMNGVARIGGWLHLPLSPERLQKLTENYVSSNAKIKAALGIDRMPVRAMDGLKKTLESFAGKER